MAEKKTVKAKATKKEPKVYSLHELNIIAREQKKALAKVEAEKKG